MTPPEPHVAPGNERPEREGDRDQEEVSEVARRQPDRHCQKMLPDREVMENPQLAAAPAGLLFDPFHEPSMPLVDLSCCIFPRQENREPAPQSIAYEN